MDVVKEDIAETMKRLGPLLLDVHEKETLGGYTVLSVTIRDSSHEPLYSLYTPTLRWKLNIPSDAMLDYIGALLSDDTDDAVRKELDKRIVDGNEKIRALQTEVNALETLRRTRTDEVVDE